MSETVIVHGEDAAFAALRRNVEEIQTGAEAIARSTADDVLSTVMGSVPVESGTLRNSLTTLVVEGGSSVAYDGSAAYAGWIEFGGTRGRAYVGGGRWLFPIGQRAAHAFQAALEQDAARQIASYPWPSP
jgi:hypothetical protein